MAAAMARICLYMKIYQNGRAEGTELHYDSAPRRERLSLHADDEHAKETSPQRN